MGCRAPATDIAVGPETSVQAGGLAGGIDAPSGRDSFIRTLRPAETREPSTGPDPRKGPQTCTQSICNLVDFRFMAAANAAVSNTAPLKADTSSGLLHHRLDAPTFRSSSSGSKYAVRWS